MPVYIFGKITSLNCHSSLVLCTMVSNSLDGPENNWRSYIALESYLFAETINSAFSVYILILIQLPINIAQICLIEIALILQMVCKHY